MTQSLEDLLKAAVLAVIGLANERGLTALPIGEYEVVWMEPESATSSHGKSKMHTYPSFRILSNELKDAFANAEDIKLLNADAKEFSRKNGKFLPFFPAEGFSENQGEHLLKAYFNETGTLTLNEDIVAKVVKTFQEDLISDNEVIFSAMQLQNFSADAPFELYPGITFRPITMEDIARYGRIDTFVFEMGKTRWIDLKDWICEIRRPIVKATAGYIGEPLPLTRLSSNNFHRLPEYIALALNLASIGNATFENLYRSSESPFLQFSWSHGGGEKIFTSRLGSKMHLTQGDIAAFQKIFKDLEFLFEGNKYQEIELPLRRIRSASGRRDAGDHLVDCVIGLEYFLAPSKGESTYKFSIRGASLLPDSIGSPSERLKIMKDLYNARSDIVHGAKGSREGIDERCKSAENILREIIIWFLNVGLKIGNREKVAGVLDEALIKGGGDVRDLIVS